MGLLERVAKDDLAATRAGLESSVSVGKTFGSQFALSASHNVGNVVLSGGGSGSVSGSIKEGSASNATRISLLNLITFGGVRRNITDQLDLETAQVEQTDQILASQQIEDVQRRILQNTARLQNTRSLTV